jgi:DNA-binding transcriptional ArsR family regulator
MVNYLEPLLDRTFAALAHPARRSILARLAKGDAKVGELAAPFAMSAPAVSKHLRVLERANLVRCDKDGRVRRMHLDAAPMREARAWIDDFRGLWDQQLDQLDAFLTEAGGEEAAK